MSEILSSTDFDGANGGEQVQAAIDAAAKRSGHGIVNVPPAGPDGGCWVVTDTLEVPSHTTLVLSGAELSLADGVNDNLVRNRNFDDGDEEVHLVGLGGARLDGNAANQRRLEEMYLNYGLHFYNVEGLSVRGVTVGPTNAWGMTLENVRDVQVTDIRFAQDGSTPNQDGIHILGPSKRVNVHGLTGACGDDVVAVNATDHATYSRGDGGDVHGVTITNVTAENSSISGLLRTLAEEGNTVDGVHASNLMFTDDAGGGDAVIKIGWFGRGVDGQPDPGEHRNITVSNVWVREWDGPYAIVKSPVGNLTLSGLRGRHTGPLFYNLENDVDGLTIENCRTTLVGDPPETMFTELYEEVLSGEHGVLTDEYREQIHGTTLEDGRPGVVSLDHANLRDVRIRDSTFDTDTDGEDSRTTAVRVFGSAAVSNCRIQNVDVRNHGTGIRVDDGADVSPFLVTGTVQEHVGTPWDLNGHSPTVSHNQPRYGGGEGHP